MTEVSEQRLAESSWEIRVMEVWMEKAGPWVDLLLKGVAVTVELVKGKPR